MECLLLSMGSDNGTFVCYHPLPLAASGDVTCTAVASTARQMHGLHQLERIRTPESSAAVGCGYRQDQSGEASKAGVNGQWRGITGNYRTARLTA